MYNLSFLKIGKYEHFPTTVCDFQNAPRPFYSIGFMAEGVGEYRFDNTAVRVKKGDIIFVPMSSTYISTWDKSDYSVMIGVHFQFDFPSPFPKHYSIPIQKISLGNYQELYASFENLCKEYDEQQPFQFSVLGLFYSILSKVYPCLEFTRNPRIDDRIKKAVEYIENYCTENISISQLADISNMSVSHFHACFKAQLGCSPIEYKHSVCIRHAELMLIENTKKSIEAISAELGFDSSIYFRKVFKKITGKTPREYRKTEIQ